MNIYIYLAPSFIFCFFRTTSITEFSKYCDGGRFKVYLKERTQTKRHLVSKLKLALTKQ